MDQSVGHGAHGVRADLAEVFRRDYRLVVGVAARVLGSADAAEDVAQEVFLSFGRASVPAAEARGRPCVATAHTALNHLRRAVRLGRTQAVALVRHSGLSCAEVAAALDLSPTSVGTTVRRAESALREELTRHASSD